MVACAHCHSTIHQTSRFCSECGSPVGSAAQMRNVTGQQVSANAAHLSTLSGNPIPTHSGFAQVFGLDPRIALLTVVVDSMLFGGQLVTLGTSTMFSVPAGAVLGLITYRAQRHWYGDDRESALIKGLIVGLLTAIPTSLPGLLTIPSGIVGLWHLLPGKRKVRSLT